MRIGKKNKKGMTLPEVMVSFAVGALMIGIVLSMWYFAYRNWSLERIKTMMRIDLGISTERIKEEVRLSSTTYMSFSPINATEYTAVSMPKAERDAQGFLDLDTDGNIIWNSTVIYHTYNDSGNLTLRRTEFSDNNAVLSNKTYREAQLASVVATGDGSGWTQVDSETSETKVIVKDLSDFSILPKTQNFDGYSATLARSQNIKFGGVRLDPGYHNLTFEAIGQNGNATGYRMGIDSIAIVPSGCEREAEVYTPADSSGDSTSIESEPAWSGKSYLEYASDAPGDYMTIQLYYDAWLETNFHNSQRNNVVLTDFQGADRYIAAKLSSPKEAASLSWQASEQTGNDTTLIDTLAGPVSVRNVISGSTINLEPNQKLIRVKFVNAGDMNITMNGAYLVQRWANDDAIGPTAILTAAANPGDPTILVDSTAGFFSAGTAHLDDGINPMDSFNFTGITNTTFTGVTGIDNVFAINDTVRGQGTVKQLYFSDPAVPIGSEEGGAAGQAVENGGGSAAVNVTIPSGQYLWTNWAIMTLAAGTDYLASFYVSNAGAANTTYWVDNNVSATHSYVQAGDHAYETIWEGAVFPQNKVYATEIAQDWGNVGTITSLIYDTKITNPSYGTIDWDASVIANTSVSMEVRASDNEDMSSPTAWAPATKGGSISVSLDGHRYIQFRATLTSTSSYDAYPWIDDVSLMWPGVAKMCEISSYFTKKPNYGIIKLTVDGQELTKGLEFDIGVATEFRDDTYGFSMRVEVEPRNSGK